MDRTIVIGDLHGCFDELNQLLKLANYKKGRDRLIFTGDLINRGPKSKQCIDFFINEKAESVMGNHEYWLLKAVDEGFSEYEIYKKMQAEFGNDFLALIKLLKKLPLWIDFDDYIVVHAGLHPKLDVAKTDPVFLTNVRKISDDNGKMVPWFNLYKGRKTVIFGHWARLEGVFKKNIIGLDSGCVYGKSLTGLILPGREIIKVPATRVYYQHSI